MEECFNDGRQYYDIDSTDYRHIISVYTLIILQKQIIINH